MAGTMVSRRRLTPPENKGFVASIKGSFSRATFTDHALCISPNVENAACGCTPCIGSVLHCTAKSFSKWLAVRYITDSKGIISFFLKITCQREQLMVLAAAATTATDTGIRTTTDGLVESLGLLKMATAGFSLFVLDPQLFTTAGLD